MSRFYQQLIPNPKFTPEFRIRDSRDTSLHKVSTLSKDHNPNTPNYLLSLQEARVLSRLSQVPLCIRHGAPSHSPGYLLGLPLQVFHMFPVFQTPPAGGAVLQSGPGPGSLPVRLQPDN